MPFTGIANPEQLAVLRGAVDEYCGVRGIMEAAQRDDVAAAVLALYSSGTQTSEAIMASLEASSILQMP